MKNIVLFIVFISIVTSCVPKQKSSLDLLFEKAFGIVSTNYIKTNEVDWSEVEKNIRDSIPLFRNNDDVHNAIKYTLDFINDKHSFFLKPNENFFSNDTLEVPEIGSKIVGKNIAYIKIPGFGANDSLSTLFSLKIRKAFKELDESHDLAGWIIDLKDNNGGAAFSQVLGISPLFQDSIICYLKDNKDNFSAMTCANNTFKIGKGVTGRINFDNTLKNKNKKIAVLINKKTASCGELVALALRYQGAKTQIFGTSSRGLTTTLITISFLPSKAALFLSNQYMCDLNKNIIDGVVVPDIECTPETSLDKAIAWIKNTI